MSDIKIHEIIDKLNPNLRSIENFEGKKRVREFYAMSSEDAYDLLKAIAENEWYAKGRDEHSRMKSEMYKKSKERIKSIDAVLALNFDKNGKSNYVEGATFIELYEAFMENKKIYLWNEIPEGILFDEISGFKPIIISGNLDLVK